MCILKTKHAIFAALALTLIVFTLEANLGGSTERWQLYDQFFSI